MQTPITMTQTAISAVQAVTNLANDHDEALRLLDQFCERFYWIKDHPDFQREVRGFLTDRGHQPKPFNG